MHRNKHIIRSFSAKRYFTRLTTSSSEMHLLSIVIDLYTCYIVHSITIRLVLLSNTTFIVRLLKRARTLLRILDMVRLVALGPILFGNKWHIGRGVRFQFLFLHFEVL